MARKEIFQKLSLNIRTSLYIVNHIQAFFVQDKGLFSLSILPRGHCIVQCPFSILSQTTRISEMTELQTVNPRGVCHRQLILTHVYCFDFLFLKSGSGRKELINYLNLIIYYVFPESTWAFFQNSPFP